MGVFGIYVAILTLIYIAYYAYRIVMDLVGNDGKKKAEVEEFAVGDSCGEDFDEEPIRVSEDGDIPVADSGEAEDTAISSSSEDAAMATTGKSEEQMAAEILAADDNALYDQAMARKKEMVKFCSESEDEQTADEYMSTLNHLMEKVEDNAENTMDDLDV